MSSTEGGVVLVVDDDADIRDALCDVLQLEGVPVALARDGAEALQWLRTHPAPRLVLLDWNMGPMNGQQFMRALAGESFEKVPVVLLTADARVQEVARAHAFAGALKKPVKLDELFALLDRH